MARKTMKIGTRMALGFGAVVALLALVGGGGYWGLKMVSERNEAMMRGNGQLAQHAARARGGGASPP